MRNVEPDQKTTSNKPTEKISRIIEKANLLPRDEWFIDSKTIIARAHFWRTGKEVSRWENPYGESFKYGYRAFSILPKEDNDFYSDFGKDIDIEFEERFEAIDDFELSRKLANLMLEGRLNNYPLVFAYVFPSYEDKSSGKIDFTSYIKTPFERFDELIYLKKTLFEIVYAVNRHIDSEKYDEKSSEFVELGIIRKELAHEPTFSINGKGQMTFELDPLKEALKDIDVRRLRICPICTLIFWAYRFNQKVCSRKCSNKFHQRRFLSNLKKRGEVNEKRRLNYAYKKAVTFIKKAIKKDGEE